MSEPANIALIHRLYDAFSRGDVATILSNLTPDVEWIFEGPAIVPFTGKRHGIEETKGFFTALATTQSGMKLTTDEFVAQGDRVATYGRYTGTVTATGKKFDSPVGHFFQIKDGKVARFVNMGDTAAYVEAYTASSSARA
jgi:ketosteroid isomerase-like protein